MEYGGASGLEPSAYSVAIRFMRAGLTRYLTLNTGAVNMITAIVENTLHLALDSAPWLLFGLIAAGLIHAWLPLQLVGKALGGSGPMAVIKAALIGAPLPLCSCGTLPAAIALSRSGASPASTTSFLISTPETGVDSVALSWVLLGPIMALLRPVAAIISAISAGLMVGATGRPSQQESGAVTEAITQEQPGDTACCCASGSSVTQTKQDPGYWQRTYAGLRYAFSDLLDDLALWLLLGMLAAGVVVTLVPPGLLVQWGSGLSAMLLVLLISVPMYVCATASTPLAHAMLFAGVSPGTVLVFLLAGPASNIASLMLVRKELGGRALISYLLAICGVSILLGLALDWVILLSGIDILSGSGLNGKMAYEPPIVLASLSLLLLVVCGVRPLRRFVTHGKGGDEGGCCG
jgi:uncharacterized protein